MGGPILGLDYGTRRIGLAISDDAASIAFPAGVLDRVSLARDLAALGDLVRERGIRSVVVGLPLHMDGTSSDTAEAARGFAAKLAEAVGLPVEMLDERWSSAEAERALRDAPRGKRRRKGAVDALAATLILRTWLDRSRALRTRLDPP